MTKPKSFSLIAAQERNELIPVEILSTNTVSIKMLQTYLLRIGNIHLLNVHKSVQNFLCTQTESAALFADMSMVNEDLMNEIKIRSQQLNVIGIGSRQQFEKNNLNELLFYFLQSPIMFGELLSVINLLKVYFSASTTRCEKKYLLIKSEYKIIKINFDDILFIAGMKDYIRIHLKTRPTPVTTLQNLKDFEKKLPAMGFIRVHKSYIIAAQHIDCISRNEISIGNYSIPVGEAFRSELNKFISENS